tara:strand:- start:463 stop:1731 length:1269 start_codon:yes stop_codon:yes gene_type:complete
MLIEISHYIYAKFLAHTRENELLRIIKKIQILFLIGIIFISGSVSQIQTRKIADGFDKPIYAVSHPTDHKMIIVVEQKGVIQIINNKTVLKLPFLDIQDRVHYPLFPGDEMGLLGFAFHPEFSINGFCFVNYVDKNDYSIISRFKADSLTINPSSEKILLKLKQPYSNHNGGGIAFGPDGYLYIGFGDGGSAGDPETNAQNLNNFLGKILRIDVNTNPDQYTIPQNNPFIGKKNVKEEIFCYGLRNPWRFSFDSLTGNLFIGDVGQNNWEEIDVILANKMGGQNFGWNIMEGFHCYPEEIECNNTNLIEPIWEYPNNANYLKTLAGIKQNKMDGCSITGGYVYRGNKIPEFYGRYIFGDYCTGKVWSFIYENGETKNIKNHTPEILNSMNKNSFYLSSFGKTNEGELFIVDYNGGIYIITSL